MSRTVEVTLKFNATDLQDLLDAANFGEKGALQLDDMTESKFAEFVTELEGNAGVFKEEIVEGSIDACANDWLYDWSGDEIE